MLESEILKLIEDPTKIIELNQAQQIIAFLNGMITDKAMEEYELRLAASAHRLDRLQSNRHAEKQDKLSESELKALWEVSSEHQKWQYCILALRKLRSIKSDIQRKYEVISSIKQKY